MKLMGCLSVLFTCLIFGDAMAIVKVDCSSQGVIDEAVAQALREPRPVSAQTVPINPAVEELDLQKNHLTSRGAVEILKRALGFDRLQSLNLSGNRISWGDADFESFLKELSHLLVKPNIREVLLGGNYFARTDSWLTDLKRKIESTIAELGLEEACEDENCVEKIAG